jgi:hypothetical protein
MRKLAREKRKKSKGGREDRRKETGSPDRRK